MAKIEAKILIVDDEPGIRDYLSQALTYIIENDQMRIVQATDGMDALAKIKNEVVLYPGHNYGGMPYAPMGEVRETNSYLQINSLEDWMSVMGG